MFDAEKAKNNSSGLIRLPRAVNAGSGQEMTKLAADMMQSSKQGPGATVVTRLTGDCRCSNIAAFPQPSTSASSANTDTDGLAAKLAKLNRLFEAGLIDEAELQQKKAAIINEV